MNQATIIEALARIEVRGLTVYNAGLSSETVRSRYGLERVAKLGSNENPLGVAPGVPPAVASAATEYSLYPDSLCSELRADLARKLGIDADHLVFGNGSEELLSLVSRVFLDHGDEVVTVVPSFGLHISYPTAMGATVKCIPLKDGGEFDVEAMIAALGPRTRLIMFSCPSNPVGSTLQSDQLQSILDALPAHTLLVFDEAYYEYAQVDASYPDCFAMLKASGKTFILLRTFSKAYSLAGLRVGYGIVSDVRLADLLNRLRPSFNVNRCAQAAALAALADDAHLLATVEHVALERVRVAHRLRELDLQPIPTLANFLFFSTPFEAEKVSQGLLRRGVIVKPWREAGYTRYLRVSIGSADDNELFLESLAVVLREQQ